MNGLIRLTLTWALWGCFLAALLFIVRIFVVIFSPKVVGQMRKHPVIHVIWGGFASIVVLFILSLMNWSRWPPLFVKRKAQRAKVLQRIQAAGGWTALQKDCDALMAEYHDSAFIWYRRSANNTNELPPTIAVLNPYSVIFYSPEMVRGSKDFSKTPVVRIKVFGSHSTGGHSTPYFGLDVVCSTNAESYRPLPSQGGASGNHNDSYRRLTKTIYERF